MSAQLSVHVGAQQDAVPTSLLERMYSWYTFRLQCNVKPSIALWSQSNPWSSHLPLLKSDWPTNTIYSPHLTLNMHGKLDFTSRCKICLVAAPALQSNLCCDATKPDAMPRKAGLIWHMGYQTHLRVAALLQLAHPANVPWWVHLWDLRRVWVELLVPFALWMC